MTEWIKCSDRLPNHQQIILAYAHTKSGKPGFGVATFVDSVKMNEEMRKSQYPWEQVDVNANPYYFVSQEVRQHTFKNVTHWQELREPPKD